SFYPLAFEIEEALRESKDLYLECDMKADKKMEITASAKTVYGPGDGLSKHLSPDTKRAFDEYLEWSGESPEMYEQYRPFAVAGIIGGNALRRANYKGELGIDMHLYKEMKAASKPVLGLESTADHMLSPDARKTEQDQERTLANELADLR